MKKVLFIISLVFIGLVIGCSNNFKTYEEIDYNTYTEMIKNKESFSLFIGSNDCTHCDDYKKTLNKIIKEYQIDVKYIDLDKLEDKEINEFKSQNSFSGTPTTIFIKNGIEDSHYNRIVGAQDYDKIVQKFKDNGYIEVK